MREITTLECDCERERKRNKGRERDNDSRERPENTRESVRGRVRDPKECHIIVWKAGERESE